MRVPAILIPFPAATDNHQFHNARALVETGAARMLGEQHSTPENLTRIVSDLMTNPVERRRLASALADWHYPNAACSIAEAILKKIPDWPGRVNETTKTANESNNSGMREMAVVADLKFGISNLKLSM